MFNGAGAMRSSGVAWRNAACAANVGNNMARALKRPALSQGTGPEQPGPSAAGLGSKRSNTSVIQLADNDRGDPG